MENYLKRLRTTFKRILIPTYISILMLGVVMPLSAFPGSEIIRTDRSEMKYSLSGNSIRSDLHKGTTQQKIKVSGTVTDTQTGETLPGVNIVVQGTTAGTTTDSKGNYTIDAPTDAILIYSFVGYKEKKVEVQARQTIDVQLQKAITTLEEVVAVGYGTQIRKNLSSSISKVKTEDITSVPTSSFEGSLQGQAAGVQVTSSSALAGSAVQVRIRGTSSASANSEPLYVIDGIPVEGGQISSSQPGAEAQVYDLQTAANTNVLASLNPEDIESVEVLKDAAAAAIYGSRGANGVVLITTKSGKAGKTQINASASFGISEVTNRMELLNSEQYIKLAKEAWYNSGNSMENFWDESGILTGGLTKEQALNTNTDWIDEMLQIGQRQEYNISARGGDEKTQFYLSANVKDESTILKGNNYQRLGTRLNIEHQLSNRFRIGTKMMLSHVDDQQVPTSWAGGIGNVTDMLPIWPVRAEDGSYFRAINNPVAQTNLRDIHLKSNQLFGNWFLKANIIDGLTFRSEFGANLLYNDDFHYRAAEITYQNRAVSSTVLGNQRSWNWKNILNYVRDINNNHFDILLATEAQNYVRKVNTMVGEGFFNTIQTRPQDASVKHAIYNENEYSFMSYIGRLNYDYNDRYLLSMSLRADGSSRFGEGNRWGYFPAASVGYILSEENYFEGLSKIFNFVKLRASYGIVGNAEIGDYAYYSSFANQPYDGNAGIILNNLGDEDLGWESTQQLDIGLSLEALEGNIRAELDYYHKKTSDLLLPFPVSEMTGVAVITRNVGELSNEGIDVMLGTTNIKTSNFSWETDFTFNYNINKVEKLADELGEGLQTSQGLSSVELYEGHPVGTKAMVEWGGVDAATGEDIYIDTDGNQLLYSEVLEQYSSFQNFYDEHKQPMGNPWPEYTGGINNRLKYKDWYMNVQFAYAAGMDFILGEHQRSVAAFGGVKVNPSTDVLDRWRNPGDEATVSELTNQNTIWTPTSEHLESIDYLRLRNLTLGYRFDMKENALFNGINCYVKAINLLTFTNAPDYLWDPEYRGVVQSRTAGNLSTLEHYKTTPQAKMFIIGLKADL